MYRFFNHLHRLHWLFWIILGLHAPRPYLFFSTTLVLYVLFLLIYTVNGRNILKGRLDHYNVRFFLGRRGEGSLYLQASPPYNRVIVN